MSWKNLTARFRAAVSDLKEKSHPAFAKHLYEGDAEKVEQMLKNNPALAKRKVTLHFDEVPPLYYISSAPKIDDISSSRLKNAESGSRQSSVTQCMQDDQEEKEIISKYAATAEVLLKYGASADPVRFSSCERTPLFEASLQGHAPIVDVLLRHNDPTLDMLLRDSRELSLKTGGTIDKRLTALMEAVREGYSDVVELLLKAGAKTDIAGETRESLLSAAHHRLKDKEHLKAIFPATAACYEEMMYTYDKEISSYKKIIELLEKEASPEKAPKISSAPAP